MFNDDQKEHMASLARQPLDTLCYCGWYRLSEGHDCHPDKTKTHADAVAASCPDCHSYPSPPMGLVHRRYCPRGEKE